MEITEKSPEAASVGDQRRERLKLILNRVFQGNKAAFAKSINVDPSTLNKVLSGKTKGVSTFIIEGVLENVEDRDGQRVSRRWLEEGIGDTFLNQSQDESDLEERARSTYLQLVGPGGRIMMQVDLVIMTTTKPHQIPLDVKEGIG